MSLISDITLTLLMPGYYRADWTAVPGISTYYVWQHGELVDTPTTNTTTIVARSGEYPQIEVATAESDVPNQLLFPGRIVLACWTPPDGDLEVDHLRIDELVSAAWVATDYSFENRAKYHLRTMAWAKDQSTHAYRLVPVYSTDQEGEATQQVAFVVRHPTRRVLAAAYAGGNLNLTEA